MKSAPSLLETRLPACHLMPQQTRTCQGFDLFNPQFASQRGRMEEEEEEVVKELAAVFEVLEPMGLLEEVVVD